MGRGEVRVFEEAARRSDVGRTGLQIASAALATGLISIAVQVRIVAGAAALDRATRWSIAGSAVGAIAGAASLGLAQRMLRVRSDGAFAVWIGRALGALAAAAVLAVAAVVSADGSREAVFAFRLCEGALVVLHVGLVVFVATLFPRPVWSSHPLSWRRRTDVAAIGGFAVAALAVVVAALAV